MKNILLIFGIFCLIKTYAQSNLVINSSFEKHDSIILACGGEIRMNTCDNWSDPNRQSSDLYYPKGCYGQDDIPYFNNNIFKYPKDGKCFAGGVTFDGNSGFKEFLQCRFIDTLKKSNIYAIKYYISLHFESRCFTDFGFYFTNEKIDTFDSNIFNKPNVIPQYENPSTNWINTFEGWQEMKGIYRATGGEKHASIGNFTKDSFVNRQLCTDTFISRSNSAYYFIDDVAIYDTSVIDTIKLCINDSTEINHQWYKPSPSIINEPFDSGVVVRHYIEALPNSTSYTEIDVPYHIGDTVKAGFLWVCHSSVSQTPTFVCDSFDTGMTGCYRFRYVWPTPDTFVDAYFQNIYGCDSTVRYHVRTNVGIGEPNTTTYNDITIYPNPAEQNINFLISKLANENTAGLKVEIYDAVGRSIKYDLINTKTTKDSSEFKINISNFSSGMYFVKVYDKNNRNIANGKFICR